MSASQPPHNDATLEARRSLDRVRDALRADLEAPTPRTWRADVALTLAATCGLSLAATLGLYASGALSASTLVTRAPTLALLALVQLAGAWAAFAPGAHRARALALSIAALAMGALVLLRGAGQPGTLPPYLCTVSHFGASMLPALLALALLPRAALTTPRALAAGASAGSLGAVLGELACGQGAQHVALFHLPAWLAAAGLTLVLARRARPRSFAP